MSTTFSSYCSKNLINLSDDLSCKVLLIVDIMKRTEKSQPDHENLRRAICALEEVMTYAHLLLCLTLYFCR